MTLWLGLGLLGLGCAHTVQVVSDPPGATVRLDGEKLGVTPLVTHIPWRPPLVRAYSLEVRLPGHRTVETSLRNEVRVWGPVLWSLRHPASTLRGDPLHDLEFVMIPRHEAAGTWGPDDVP